MAIPGIDINWFIQNGLPLPAGISPPGPGGLFGGGFDFNSLSDDDLLAFAGQFGIDTTPFIGGGDGGLLEQVGAVPSFNQPLPTANVGQPNIPTNLPSPIGFKSGIPNLPQPYGGAALPALPNFGGQAPIDISTQLGAAQTLSPLGLNVGAPRVEISPEARSTVAGIYGPIRQQAREEILRTATEAAGRRGLNMTDTPIFEPLLRQQALVESQIGGQEAGAVLGLSESLRNFLQQQAQAREGAIQSRFGLTANQNIQREQLFTQRQQLLDAARQARDRGDESRAGLLEQAAQQRSALIQRMGEFGTSAGQQNAQIMEQAIQGRFGLQAQQAAQRQSGQLGLLSLGEQARQYGGQFGLGLAGLQEGAIQNRFNLGNQALLGRTQLLEATRQFQSQFENQLRQQAYQNRLQLAGQIGQTGLGLANARFGTPTSTTQVGPLNLTGGIETLGRGMTGLGRTGFFS